MHQSELRKLGWPKNVIKDMGLENYGLPDDPVDNVNAFARVVTPREFNVVFEHYANFETYKSIGKRLGMTGARAQQIAIKAQHKFKCRILAWRRHEREAAEKAEREAKIAAITDIRDMEFKDWFDLVYPSPDKLEIRILNGIFRGFGYYLWEANGCPRNASREAIWPVITVGNIIETIKTGKIYEVRNLGIKSVNRLIEMLLEAGITKEEMGLE